MKRAIFTAVAVFSLIFASCATTGLFRETQNDVGASRVYGMNIARENYRQDRALYNLEILFIESEALNTFALLFSRNISLNEINLQRNWYSQYSSYRGITFDDYLLSGEVSVRGIILKSNDPPSRSNVGDTIIETFIVNIDEGVFQQIFSENKDIAFSIRSKGLIRFREERPGATGTYSPGLAGAFDLNLSKPKVSSSITQFFEKHKNKL